MDPDRERRRSERAAAIQEELRKAEAMEAGMHEAGQAGWGLDGAPVGESGGARDGSGSSSSSEDEDELNLPLHEPGAAVRLRTAGMNRTRRNPLDLESGHIIARIRNQVAQDMAWEEGPVPDAAAAIVPQWRTVVVYVSSLCSGDAVTERRILHTKVFPALRLRFEQRMLRVLVCDPHICALAEGDPASPAAVAEHLSVLRGCKDEAAERAVVFGVRGEEYGYSPPRDELPAALAAAWPCDGASVLHAEARLALRIWGAEGAAVVFHRAPAKETAGAEAGELERLFVRGFADGLSAQADRGGGGADAPPGARGAAGERQRRGSTAPSGLAGSGADDAGSGADDADPGEQSAAASRRVLTAVPWVPWRRASPGAAGAARGEGAGEGQAGVESLPPASLAREWAELEGMQEAGDVRVRLQVYHGPVLEEGAGGQGGVVDDRSVGGSVKSLEEEEEELEEEEAPWALNFGEAATDALDAVLERFCGELGLPAEPLYTIEQREERLEAKRLLAATSVKTKVKRKNAEAKKAVTRPSYRETIGAQCHARLAERHSRGLLRETSMLTGASGRTLRELYTAVRQPPPPFPVLTGHAASLPSY